MLTGPMAGAMITHFVSAAYTSVVVAVSERSGKVDLLLADVKRGSCLVALGFGWLWSVALVIGAIASMGALIIAVVWVEVTLSEARERKGEREQKLQDAKEAILNKAFVGRDDEKKSAGQEVVEAEEIPTPRAPHWQ